MESCDVKEKEYRMVLSYISGSLNENDIFHIEEKLKENGIEFKSIDKSGKFTASLDEFSNVYSFLITSTLSSALLTGALTNAVWDSIKYISLFTFKKFKGKKYNKISDGRIEEKKVTYGIEIKANNDHYNFKFTGLTSDEVLLEALDKILPHIKSKPNESSKIYTPGLPNYIVSYDEKLKIWIAKETNEIIKEKIENANSKKS
ncbi:hypothetical protein EJP82_12050 [Paenibacillus anaericanus]|uniref:Uncharacterized protein n=1 Tax=Paenibacillus anaericanus TaxID=170367 RepID=A0A433Y9H1_9BACL|nr:hypothetical protein [Paenibacillus anaericanus]RUT46574.1 hypothetical protein EJP82_12050 [Paenibacillus anaericanus]